MERNLRYFEDLVSVLVFLKVFHHMFLSFSLRNKSMCYNIPNRQIYVRGIFVEHSHDTFLEHAEKVPYEIPGNIPNYI